MARPNMQRRTIIRSPRRSSWTPPKNAKCYYDAIDWASQKSATELRDALNALTLRAAQRRSDASTCRVAISTIGLVGSFFATILAIVGLGFPLAGIQASSGELDGSEVMKSVDDIGRSLETLFDAFRLTATIFIFIAVVLLFISWLQDRGAAKDENSIAALEQLQNQRIDSDGIDELPFSWRGNYGPYWRRPRRSVDRRSRHRRSGTE